MTPRVEIVTMDRQGLDAFIHELKRVKLRHQYAEELAKVPEEKQNKALDKLIASWEQQQVGIVSEARKRKIESEQDDDDSDSVSAITAEFLNSRSYREAQANHLERTFASVRFYVGKLNRDINEGRVATYQQDMEKGKWWMTPDPIVVTDTGEIINGQHRLIAAEAVAKGVQIKPAGEDRCETTTGNGDDGQHAPTFVVVWGVDKKAAILMDEARRTATDRRDIAVRFATAGAR